MDILKQLNDAIAYIEAHLCDQIDMDEVARRACASAEGFSRYFSYMVGMTVNEYIRRRRLTQAAYDLRFGADKVIDVAMKHGYGSADAFAKAFARQHGIAPSEARDASRPLKVFPPVSFHIAIKGASEMDFRLVECQGMDVYGVSRQFAASAAERFAERSTMWDQKQDFMPVHVSTDWEGAWYGVWDGGKYTIAREKGDATGEHLEQVRIPAGLYAAFTTARGGVPEETLRRLHDLIFDSWLPDSGYAQAGDYEVEIYHLHQDPVVRRRERYYEIWVPVKRAAATEM